MEESGHYYTVYFTSLAVGFNEATAYWQAVLAQMPDEVGWLDAANMHLRQCYSGTEHDLSGNKKKVNAQWRYKIEHSIHSLPDKINGNRDSGHQQAITKKLLLAESPLSLKFALLLHRLGDTYAHSQIGEESKMYTVSSSGNFSECFSADSLGHARHLHDPDYPFLRTNLFDKYLTELYTVLNAQARQVKNSGYLRHNSKPLLLDEVKNIFKKALTNPHGVVQVSMLAGLSKKSTQNFFIQQIREQAKRHLGLALKPYAPERLERQTLPQFLSDHNELFSGNRIDEHKITEAVDSIDRDLAKTPLP